MARIRTVKPDFFKHYELYQCEQESGLPIRVAFAGLWTVCDREGRFKWVPPELKISCLPYDDVDFSRVLDALITRGFVVKYECKGRVFGLVPGFKEHQVINNREAKSVLPDPFGSDSEIISDSGDLTRAPRVNDACISDETREDHADTGERKGKEGKGKEGKEKYKADFGQAENHADLDDQDPPPKKIPYQKIVDLYHELLPELPKVQALTEARKGQIRQRMIKGQIKDLNEWRDYFEHVKDSKFLTGKTEPAPGRKVFVADLEWLTKESNFVKVWEGKYHGKAA